jgi:hypothetical protein
MDTKKYNALLCWIFEKGYHYIAQAGFELVIPLPQLHSAGIIGLCHHAPQCNVLFLFFSWFSSLQ